MQKRQAVQHLWRRVRKGVLLQVELSRCSGLQRLGADVLLCLPHDVRASTLLSSSHSARPGQARSTRTSLTSRARAPTATCRALPTLRRSVAAETSVPRRPSSPASPTTDACVTFHPCFNRLSSSSSGTRHSRSRRGSPGTQPGRSTDNAVRAAARLRGGLKLTRCTTSPSASKTPIRARTGS